MRIRNTGRAGEDQGRLQMSSMIDVVFLLLIFFVMTFQVVAVEGDFSVATAGAALPQADPDPPRQIVFHVRLLANSGGELEGIRFDERQLENVDALSQMVSKVVQDHVDGGGRRSDLSVRLNCDDAVPYQHAMDAITAIRGGHADHPLIDDIRFVSKP